MFIQYFFIIYRVIILNIPAKYRSFVSELKIYNLQRYRENINFFVAIINYEKDSSQKIATQRNFQSAILKFVRSKNFVKSKFLTQIQKYPFTLERKSTIDDYVTLIMYIYNYAQKKNKIQYSDIMGDN